MALFLPNTIENEQDADGDKLQQNFETIRDYVNQDVITSDGMTAMTAPLLLVGAPTQPLQASTKDYVDQLDATQKTYVDTQIAAAVAVVPWIALTPAGPWSNFGGTYPPLQYRKVGDLVHLRGAVKSSAPISPVPNTSTFATLPTGFRSAYTTTVPCIYADNANGYPIAGSVIIETDGSIKAVAATNAGTLPHVFTALNLQFSVTA